MIRSRLSLRVGRSSQATNAATARKSFKSQTQKSGHSPLELDQDLHGNLIERCVNEPLLRVLDQTRLLIIATRYIFHDSLSISNAISKQSALEHLRVVECLRAGDYTGAAAALNDHLCRSLGHWIRRLEQVSLVAEPPAPGFLVPADSD